MKRVTGLGGVFFKTADPKKIKEWYGKHLGLPVDEYGASFRWIDPDHKEAKEPALTAWSPFKDDTTYFQPSEKPYMFNYRVENLGNDFLFLAPIAREDVVNVDSAVITVEIHHLCFPEKIFRTLSLKQDIDSAIGSARSRS